MSRPRKTRPDCNSFAVSGGFLKRHSDLSCRREARCQTKPIRDRDASRWSERHCVSRSHSRSDSWGPRCHGRVLDRSAAPIPDGHGNGPLLPGSALWDRRLGGLSMNGGSPERPRLGSNRRGGSTSPGDSSANRRSAGILMLGTPFTRYRDTADGHARKASATSWSDQPNRASISSSRVTPGSAAWRGPGGEESR